MNQNIKEHPTGFMKWRQKLGKTICITDMFLFTFHHLKENKLKIFRWKLLHFILPCKQLLYQWKIETTPLCDTCHIIDDYEHYCISCKSLDSFWNDVKILLEKLRIGIHILSLTNLVFGYKIEDKYYNSINYFLTILLFTIYKSHYVSKQKENHIIVFQLFKLNSRIDLN
jgi:hypothetical protein